MEYCPQGSLLIIDNVITNAETGISILQSSPYIASNSIAGQSGVEYGIYLDNSNGTVEYNIVNNFQYSLYGLYSSPYLLKNTFSNASIRNIELNSGSIPVMRPLVSGSTLYWLGGDNIHEGSPTGGGIGFNNDAFPEMDPGYNRITLNSGSNYMDGTVPPMLGGTLYARLNYWREDPPNPEKFIIYDGTIDYDPWIVEEHGGCIAVTSVPGEGTTFILRFPSGEKNA